MTDFIQNFHFLRPWILLFLILPLCFYLKKIQFNDKISSWEKICDKNLLGFLLVHNNSRRRISLRGFFYVGLLSCIIGSAGPAWKKVEVPTFVIENPSMFVLSLAQDMQLKDISPSRLERAKFIISDIANHFDNGQFGLEVYSQEPYIVSPITDDIKIIKSLLSQITQDIVPDQGDRPDRAIELAIERFKSSGYSSGQIILLASDVGQRFDFALDAVQKAAKLNYSVNVIDMSFSKSDKLQLLAEKGNGIYLSVKTFNLEKLISKINEKNNEKMLLSQNLRSSYLDYGYYLVFIGLLCMLPFFRRGLLVAFITFLMSVDAEAGFLLNNNQEGLKLFNEKQYEKAVEKFEDPVWRGVSFYRQEKNEEALKEFEKVKSDIALYNTGVVLTKMCQYDKALKAFLESLKINPQNKDALYNKKVLEDLFEQAKKDPSILSCTNQQQQNNQGNNDNENKNENSDQNNSQQNEDNKQKENQTDSSQNDKSQEKQNSQQSSTNENHSSNTDNEENKPQQNQSSEQKQEDSTPQQDNSQTQSSSESDENNAEKPSDLDNENNPQNEENQNSPQKANQDNGEENKSDNTEGEDTNATENQEQEIEAPVMNAKEGDENTPYDEEALAMRRRYREIPEDPGGLLREFIKKEYMKDRYHDEN